MTIEEKISAIREILKKRDKKIDMAQREFKKNFSMGISCRTVYLERKAIIDSRFAEEVRQFLS